jgi:DNA-binding SARP family transcriptional activator/tetratricopeptide (TPR) repeat protein
MTRNTQGDAVRPVSDKTELEICLFGELTVKHGLASVPLPASKKTRALLAYLTLNPRGARRARLCDLFWDGPEDPRAALRWSLTKLRPLVDVGAQPRLMADKEQVRLELNDATIDLHCLRQLADSGFANASIEALERAVAALRGDLLEGLELPDCHQYNEWYRAEYESARRQSAELRLALIARLEQNPMLALVHARALTTADPLDQSGHAAVIRLLGRMGRTKDALEQYEVCRRILDAQLRTRPCLEVEQARMGLGQPPAVLNSPPSPTREIEPVNAADEETAVPLRVGAALGPEHPLVARDSERKALLEFLSPCDSDDANVLLVLGEPGVGKSRLLAELTGITLERGGRVLAGRGFEAEMIRPYGAWTDAFSALNPSPLSLSPPLPTSGSGSSESNAERSHLFESIVQRLRQLSHDGRSTVVVIDDIQWIDEASAALVHYASRALKGSTVRIACGARPGELGDNSAVLRLVRTLSREARLRQIGLSPLDLESTAKLAQSRFPGVDSERVYTESGGNPMYALEVARALDHGNGPTSSLQALLDDRLARLEPAPRALATWAAVVGRAFSLELLTRVSNLETNAFLGALEDLERRGFVRAVDLGAETCGYDFVHDLVRRAAYRGIPEPRRRLMHLTVARTLQELTHLQRAMAGDIAHHATLGDDPELAARFYIVAGEHSLALFAVREAAELAERGLRLIHRLAPAVRARFEVDLLGILVRADVEKRRLRELQAAMDRAVSAAHAAGYEIEVVRGRIALAYFHFDRGDFDAAWRESLRISHVASKGAPGDSVYALAHAAQCLALLERDIEKAEALIAQAHELIGPYDSGPFELTLAEGLVLHYRGDTARGLETLERASEIAEQQGEFWLLAVCLLRLAVAEFQRGAPDRTLYHCQRLNDIAGRIGEASEGLLGNIVAAAARRVQEPVGSAFDFDAALHALTVMDAKVFLAEAYCVVAESDTYAGDTNAARKHAQLALNAAEAMNRSTYIVWSRAILARLAREQGELTEARELIDSALTLLKSGDRPSAYAHRLVSVEANRLWPLTLVQSQRASAPAAAAGGY